jgi:hypothetical protein
LATTITTIVAYWEDIIIVLEESIITEVVGWAGWAGDDLYHSSFYLIAYYLDFHQLDDGGSKEFTKRRMLTISLMKGLNIKS